MYKICTKCGNTLKASYSSCTCTQELDNKSNYIPNRSTRRACGQRGSILEYVVRQLLVSIDNNNNQEYDLNIAKLRKLVE